MLFMQNLHAEELNLGLILETGPKQALVFDY